MATLTIAKLMLAHSKPFQFLNPSERKPLKLANKYVLNLLNITLVVCLLFLARASTQAQPPTPATTPDHHKVWTTIGSAGTLDESSVGKVFFDHGIVQMGRVVSPPVISRRVSFLPDIQSAVIRYNVTPVDGLFTLTRTSCTGDCSAYKLTLRYLDSGTNAQVVANLIEVDLVTGAEKRRLSFDSNDPSFPAADRYQVKSGPNSCGPEFVFDFRRKAYYVEATLKAPGIIAGSAAGIQMIKIEIGSCIG